MMYSSMLSALLLCATLGSARIWNSGIPRRSNGGIVRAPMRRRESANNNVVKRAEPQFAKRAESSSTTPSPAGVAASQYMKELLYTVELSIGDPAQTVALGFDTGSSETWLDPYCDFWGLYDLPTYQTNCLLAGGYYPWVSESAQNLSYFGEIFYGSGACLINYFVDTVVFNGDNGSSLTLPNTQFGVSLASIGMDTGLIGAAHGEGYNQNYSGLIDQLFNHGWIKDKDFSVALGNVDTNNGEILFGGIDKGRFTGELVGIPLSGQLEYDDYFRYWINFTYIGVTAPDSCVSTPLTPPDFTDRALPDTGTSLVYLPESVWDGLMGFFPGAAYDEDTGLFEVPCDYRNKVGGSVDFGFGPDLTIRVPWKEFIFLIEPMEENNQTQGCYVGALPGFGFNILGDTFLRSAYLLFRQQANTIFIAQGATCKSHVVTTHNSDLGSLRGDCHIEAAGTGADKVTTACSTGSYVSASEEPTAIIPGGGLLVTAAAGHQINGAAVLRPLPVLPTAHAVAQNADELPVPMKDLVLGAAPRDVHPEVEGGGDGGAARKTTARRRMSSTEATATRDRPSAAGVTHTSSKRRASASTERARESSRMSHKVQTSAEYPTYSPPPPCGSDTSSEGGYSSATAESSYGSSSTTTSSTDSYSYPTESYSYPSDTSSYASETYSSPSTSSSESDYYPSYSTEAEATSATVAIPATGTVTIIESGTTIVIEDGTTASDDEYPTPSPYTLYYDPDGDGWARAKATPAPDAEKAWAKEEADPREDEPLGGKVQEGKTYRYRRGSHRNV